MHSSTIVDRADYDVIVVGGSLAGCTASILLARAGARVALVERKPDPQSFKRMCSHYIQSSAIPTLERLGLLGPIERAGGVRSKVRIWTPTANDARRDDDPRRGWVDLGADSPLPPGVNLRRERLDPLLRAAAAETPGVELMLGRKATGLLREDDRIRGVEFAGGGQMRARLVIGADGRDSAIAKLARVRTRVKPSERFSYAAYYEGPAPAGSPDSSLWFLDPEWAAALPTDSELTLYLCMPTKQHLPEFRSDPEQALSAFFANLPDPPPIRASERVGPVVGKLDMPNITRIPTAPGLALAGDAAMATDPLWGVGCGWAFQSAEWLSDCVAPALRDEEPLELGLRRYRRRFLRRLAPYAIMINDYSNGRPLNPFERMMLGSAALDPHVAREVNAYSTRNAGPEHLLVPSTFARILTAHMRLRPRGPRKRHVATAPRPAASVNGGPPLSISLAGAPPPV